MENHTDPNLQFAYDATQEAELIDGPDSSQEKQSFPDEVTSKLAEFALSVFPELKKNNKE